jgi:glutamine synthetase adenylyltransferase
MGTADDRLANTPGALRPAVALWLERLEAEHGACDVPADILATLLQVVAVSEFAGNTLLREWQEFGDSFSDMRRIPDTTSLREFADEIAASDAGLGDIQSRLRRFRHRFLLQLLWREVEGSAELTETLHAL